MADIAYTSQKNGALFALPNGPNTAPVYMGCFDVDDLTENFGGINLLWCIDPDGAFKVAGDTSDPPDVTTFNMGTYTGKRKEAIEGVDCPFPLYLHIRDCGRADEFANFVRTTIVDVRKLTGRTFTGRVRRAEGVEMLTQFEASAAPPFVDAFYLQGDRISINETEPINNIVFCNQGRCAGACGGRQAVCTEGFVTTDAQTGSPSNIANVWKTTTAGSTWTLPATHPFGAGLDIVGAVCFPIGKNQTRWLVAQGEAGATAMRVAYSDDAGQTWTIVTVGSVVGQFAVGPGALFALNKYNIWLATSGGYIYKSQDGGATWTAQQTASITSGSYYAIVFKDNYVGMAVAAAGVVAKTIDGGLSWSAATVTGASNNISLGNSGDFWWVGTTAGDLYYSDDQGTIWTERSGWTGEGQGPINSIDWYSPLIGMFAQTISNIGYVLFTINGGYEWTRITISGTHAGFNQIYICSPELAWVVGEVSGGTGVIYKIQPTYD